MTGNNQLQFNQATMIEIIQEWFNSRTIGLRKQYVKSVHECNNADDGFVIKIESESE